MCRIFRESSVPPTLILRYLISVWSPILFLAFQFFLITMLCWVCRARHSFSLFLLHRAIRNGWCTNGVFWRTWMRTLITTWIDMPQLGRNRHLAWLIMLLGTVYFLMFVVTKRGSSRLTQWRFRMIQAGNGNRWYMVVLINGTTGEVAGHSSAVARALRRIRLSLVVWKKLNW